MEFNLAALVLVSLLIPPTLAIANPHQAKLLSLDNLDPIKTTVNSSTPPTVFFEVTKSIQLPRTNPCSCHILHHDFGYTYGRPPVLANYTPPSHCPSQHFSKIVFEWKATCKGRQFDRILGVWLGGVEIFRSCTAEPRPNGIVWTVEKDITRYYSLLMKNQSLAVYLGNLVDNTYTGVYHVDITIHFYPAAENSDNYHLKSDTSTSGHDSFADSILPISRNLPLNDGLWFEIQNSTDTEVHRFQIPQNAYRAVLEVYVSFHENDEFWYTNLPNDFIEANNLSITPGNGPFREVVVSLDGDVVGAIWPFTVIYTGGVNPLLWRPISGIGSFNLPSYDIEITPSLGKILDGKSHTFEFSVTNALNVWYVDANLHLWLDCKSTLTEGQVSTLRALPMVEYHVSNFEGLNGRFSWKVKRSIQSIGWVKSSHGNISTEFVQDFNYKNSMVVENDGNKQTVNQTIHFNDSVHAQIASSDIYFMESYKTFPLYLSTEDVDLGNGTDKSTVDLKLEYDEDRHIRVSSGSLKSSLRNVQTGQGSMLVRNNLVIYGLGSTQQAYAFKSDEFCYFRNVSSSNYTIIFDKVRTSCKKSKPYHLGFGFIRNMFFPSRRELLP